MRICYFLTARPSFCSTRLTALQFRRFDADHGEHALGLPPNRKVTIFCQHNELIPTSFDKSSEYRHSEIETRPSIILTISAMSPLIERLRHSGMIVSSMTMIYPWVS